MGMGLFHPLSRLGLGVAVWVLLFTALSASAVPAISGRLIQAGFGRGGNPWCRDGAWCPVVVALRLDGGTAFEGRLQVEQFDRDGDVVIGTKDLSLALPGREQIFWVYVPSNQQSTPIPFRVRLIESASGNAVKMRNESGRFRDVLASTLPQIVDQGLLVLDLSAGRIPSLISDYAATNSQGILRWPVTVASVDPQHLPDLAMGLEAVDAIVWDHPDTSRLFASQVAALLDWVATGGTLVLGGAGITQQQQLARLDELLPIDIQGTATTDTLRLEKNILGGLEHLMFRPPVTIVSASARKGATVMVHDQDSDIVVWGRYGRGRVVSVGLSLRELVTSVKSSDFRQNRNRLPKLWACILGESPTRNVQEDQRYLILDQRDIFDDIRDKVNFQGVGGAFLLVAVLFVVAYLLVSTVGVWLYLRHRSFLQYSWFAFAVCAAVMSVLSVGIVQFLRGARFHLRQLSVVDMYAPDNDEQAWRTQAHTFFGLKSPTHSELDLKLVRAESGQAVVGENAWLRPLMPEARESMPPHFAPQRYGLLADRSMLKNVPIRATLKKFQAYWEGEHTGMLTARIMLTHDRRIDTNSRIQNDLGVDLRNCFLMHTNQLDISEPGMTSGRARNINVLPLGDIRAGESLPEPGATVGFYHRIDNRKDPRVEELDISGHYLHRWQQTWGAHLMNTSASPAPMVKNLVLTGVQKSLLLASTYSELSLTQRGNYGNSVPQRSHVRRLDSSRMISRDLVLFVGFGDLKDSVRLGMRKHDRTDEASYRPLAAGERTVMYRMLIPISRDVGGE